jgi:predicted TIM-barrel fold metal-dependent hydrolase
MLAALAGTPELDAAVVLAFDAVHTPDGKVDGANTHFHVANDYVHRLAQAHPKVLFGCSVHPYRKDAAMELARCKAMGAVLCKWLPITQGFSPADPECEPFYEALAALKMPLLCHTGGEKSLPQLRPDTADPNLLRGALKRGVTVILAHCGTRSTFTETDHYEAFARLVKEYEHAWGDTSALLLPTRWSGLTRAAEDEAVRAKLLHGSDWPILPLPLPHAMSTRATLDALAERNWVRRDILIKQQLGMGEDYWGRAARVLGLESGNQGGSCVPRSLTFFER